MSLSMLEHRWYTVQTTSGHENKVLRLIQRKIDMDPATPEDRLIRQALVPTQEVVEIKNGKKVTVERKIFPGYVLVEMVASQDTLHEVNALQGVIKFVGKEKEPTPLRDDEVRRLLGHTDPTEDAPTREEIPFLIGQAVAITEGPFADFNGTVEEILSDKGKVRVSVSLFGGATSLSYAASGQLIWPLFGALVVGGAGGTLAALPLAKYLESRTTAARTIFALMVIAVAMFILLD